MANTWDGAVTNTSIASSSISDGGSATTTSAIDQSGNTATEVFVEIAYGATVNEGAFVYVLKEKAGGGAYEDIDDDPYGFEMPSAVSSTRNRALPVPGVVANSFKILVTNDSGASVTATVDYKQAT